MDDAVALEVHLVGRIHHHFGDAAVVDQRLDGAEPENLVRDERNQPLPNLAVDRVVPGGDEGGDGLLHQLSRLARRCRGQFVRVQAVDHRLVQCANHGWEVGTSGRLEHGPGAGRHHAGQAVARSAKAEAGSPVASQRVTHRWLLVIRSH